MYIIQLRMVKIIYFFWLNIKLYHIFTARNKNIHRKVCEKDVSYECHRFLYDNNDCEKNEISSKKLITERFSKDMEDDNNISEEEIKVNDDDNDDDITEKKH